MTGPAGIPSEGKLIIYSYITLKIDYKIVKEVSNEQLSDIVMDDVASEIIVNYPSIHQFYNPNPRSLHLVSYNYTIITKSSLESSITFLKNWKEYIGYTVKVVNISWISSQYSGSDLEEKIRNFLRDKYPSSEWGIEDVCIIGHYDDVPMRRCEQDLGYGKPETDYYYAELSLPDNQSWDKDGDHLYGENTDHIDFYLNNNLITTDFDPPYEYLLDDTNFGLNKLKIIAFDKNQNEMIDEVDTLIFNLNSKPISN